ncbi:MAG: hypothetical protein SGILL_008455 [Bacillariaceae sp.]
MEAKVTAEDELKPFHCFIQLRPKDVDREPREVYAETIGELWEKVKYSIDRSIYRSFVGIQGVNGARAFPLNHADLKPGKYRAIFLTEQMSNKELFEEIAERVQPPCSRKNGRSIEAELLLSYNHFSIYHEGVHFSLAETRVMLRLMKAAKDPKGLVENDVLTAEMRTIDHSESDLKQARNHVFVSLLLSELSNDEITEDLILRVHKWLMSGVLTDPDEGVAGEYRKNFIGIYGSKIGRVDAAMVAGRMKIFYKKHMLQTEGEELLDYLSRIHGEFQLIHPFADGNGRIGRIIMNLILLKHGYPILTFPTTLSDMFNQGCELGNGGDDSFFARLLAEVTYNTLLSQPVHSFPFISISVATLAIVGVFFYPFV